MGATTNPTIPTFNVTLPVGTVLTAQAVFSQKNPWMPSPTVTLNGVTEGENPQFYATQQTAQVIAGWLGGTILDMTSVDLTGGGPVILNQDQYFVLFPNGAKVNAGCVAALFNGQATAAQISGAIQQELAHLAPIPYIIAFSLTVSQPAVAAPSTALPANPVGAQIPGSVDQFSFAPGVIPAISPNSNVGSGTDNNNVYNGMTWTDTAGANGIAGAVFSAYVYFSPFATYGPQGYGLQYGGFWTRELPATS